jgi:hypothetical protein
VVSGVPDKADSAARNCRSSLLVLAVIEGSQAKRNWQWQTAECPIKIANYELMSRDQEAIVHDSGIFDLVVLDEAQRIKNTASTTRSTSTLAPISRAFKDRSMA